jgi:peptide chain release factor 2
MKKLKELKAWVTGYDEIKSTLDDLSVLFDFFKEGEAAQEDLEQAYNRVVKLIEDLELRNMLRKEEDKLGAVLKINAGAGGTESQDWAEMLMRMYVRWGEQNKYKITVNHILPGDDM